MFTLTTGIDVHTPGYVQIKVTFYFYALSMETGEDFWVQYYNGSTWSTVGTYTSGTSFSNGTFYTSTVTIDETSYTFPTAMKIRFKCDASNDSDDVYIDNVTITASTTKTAVQNQVVITELRKMDVSDAGETALSLYPNPTKGSSVTIVSGTEINNVMVYDITGKVVMTVEGENDTTMEIGVGNLSKGMYIVVVNHTDSKETTRFVIE